MGMEIASAGTDGDGTRRREKWAPRTARKTEVFPKTKRCEDRSNATHPRRDEQRQPRRGVVERHRVLERRRLVVQERRAADPVPRRLRERSVLRAYPRRDVAVDAPSKLELRLARPQVFRERRVREARFPARRRGRGRGRGRAIDRFARAAAAEGDVDDRRGDDEDEEELSRGGDLALARARAAHRGRRHRL